MMRNGGNGVEYDQDHPHAAGLGGGYCPLTLHRFPAPKRCRTASRGDHRQGAGGLHQIRYHRIASRNGAARSWMKAEAGLGLGAHGNLTGLGDSAALYVLVDLTRSRCACRGSWCYPGLGERFISPDLERGLMYGPWR